MMDKLEYLDSVLFPIFVIIILWFSWIPLRYLFMDMRKNDFDFYRDLSFLLGTIKKRYKSIFGKIGMAYLCFYVIFILSKYLISE